MMKFFGVLYLLASPTVVARAPGLSTGDNLKLHRSNIAKNHFRKMHFVSKRRRNQGSTISSTYELFYNQMKNVLDQKQTALESTVFVSHDSSGIPYPSNWYKYSDFVRVLRSMSVEGVGGGNDAKFFYIGQIDSEGVTHGLVNLSAFLAHAMALSIHHDVCDEFNMDLITQKLAISNSCGQFGNSYQDDVCSGEESVMTCGVDSDISIHAASSLTGEKSPPPFQCHRKESVTDFTGYWDLNGFVNDTFPFANRAGRIDIAGCCWWGRGVLFTRGTCSFGRLNYYLGVQAAAQGFLNFYDVDFCIYPEVVCEGNESNDLRWAVGFFEWTDVVQSYYNPNTNWNYLNELNAFVESGFKYGDEFIDAVSEILPFACSENYCSEKEDEISEKRRINFSKLVYELFGLPELAKTIDITTPLPTKQPTVEPTKEPIGKPSGSTASTPTYRPIATETPVPTPPPSSKATEIFQADTLKPSNRPSKNPISLEEELALPPFQVVDVSPPFLPTGRPINYQPSSPTNAPTFEDTILITLPSSAPKHQWNGWQLIIWAISPFAVLSL